MIADYMLGKLKDIKTDEYVEIEVSDNAHLTVATFTEGKGIAYEVKLIDSVEGLIDVVHGFINELEHDVRTILRIYARRMYRRDRGY